MIICLAKDMNANSSTSTLYISRDYGGKWDNATNLLTQSVSNDEPPLLDKFFNHPENNGKVTYFTFRSRGEVGDNIVIGKMLLCFRSLYSLMSKTK